MRNERFALAIVFYVAAVLVVYLLAPFISAMIVG
jgi:hypothetical protein